MEITWDQVDLEKKSISFQRREKIQVRFISISSEMIQHLKSKSRRSALVFETYRKEPFSRYKLMKDVNDFKRTGLCSIKWTPDDLRHSFAVIFLKDGGTFERLQYLLGHVSVQHTRALYKDCLSEDVTPITTPFK